MEIVTLEEMIETLKENVESELEGEGLSSWSINVSGQNFADNFSHYSTEDLKDLQLELGEGGKGELVIDLSVHILDYLNELISERESAAEYLDDAESEEEEESSDDYDE